MKWRELVNFVEAHKTTTDPDAPIQFRGSFNAETYHEVQSIMIEEETCCRVCEGHSHDVVKIYYEKAN